MTRSTEGLKKCICRLERRDRTRFSNRSTASCKRKANFARPTQLPTPETHETAGQADDEDGEALSRRLLRRIEQSVKESLRRPLGKLVEVV